MGLFIGPIISGAIASQINWRWFVSHLPPCCSFLTGPKREAWEEKARRPANILPFPQFWVCTILQGVSWLFTLVAHPETKYERSTSALSSERGSAVDVVALEELKKEPAETEATAGGDAEAAVPSSSSSSSSSSSGPRTAAAAVAPPTRPSTAVSASPSSFPQYRVLGRPSRAQFAQVRRARIHKPAAQQVRDAVAPQRIIA